MITLIAAISQNNAIGKNNELLWHLPNDLKHFKTQTVHSPIIMGRKTFESFGAKPLPNRHHIIISRNNTYDNENATVVDSLEKAITEAQKIAKNCFIIGGGEIYKQAINLADILEITLVKTVLEGDTFFPKIDEKTWKLVKCESHTQDEKHLYDYEFRTYQRIS